MAKDAAHARYLAHLQSPRWSGLRRQVFLRAGGICEGCGTRPITEVHHLSYAHVGEEFLFELVGLCATCHQRLHGITKGDR